MRWSLEKATAGRKAFRSRAEFFLGVSLLLSSLSPLPLFRRCPPLSHSSPSLPLFSSLSSSFVHDVVQKTHQFLPSCFLFARLASTMIATQAVSTSPPHLHVVSPQLHSQALPQHQNNQHQHPAAQRPTVLRLNSAPAPATTSTPVTMLGAHIHPNELRVMEAIAGLCSQHHMSSYSVMKFGERGALFHLLLLPTKLDPTECSLT